MKENTNHNGDRNPHQRQTIEELEESSGEAVPGGGGSLPGWLRTLWQRAEKIREPGGAVISRIRPGSSGRRREEGLTLLSANLWHDWPQHREHYDRLERFAQLVEDEGVDVALLQEVWRTPQLRVDEWLAERLGMGYAYARANGHEDALGFEEGVAVFSRFPLLRPRQRHLGPGNGTFVRRIALTADVATHQGCLSASSVHLGLLPWHNKAQIDTLMSWITVETERKRAAFIGGDFNAHETTPRMERARDQWLDLFRHANPDADGATHELRWPWGDALSRRRLDYLFMREGRKHWKLVEAEHLDAPGGPHSDHRAVLARLEPVN